jgi:hypothetical protein
MVKICETHENILLLLQLDGGITMLLERSFKWGYSVRSAIMRVPLVVAILYAVRSLIENRWISGTLVLLVALALGVIIFPVFLWL